MPSQRSAAVVSVARSVVMASWYVGMSVPLDR
jgi:hypothetical protein